MTLAQEYEQAQAQAQEATVCITDFDGGRRYIDLPHFPDAMRRLAQLGELQDLRLFGLSDEWRVEMYFGGCPCPGGPRMFSREEG